MTVTLRRARAAVAVLVVAVLAAAGARVAADTAARTSAAWTDDVHATTTVSLGTWSPQIGTCTAVKAATLEPVPNRPCEVVDVWGFQVQDSRPVGSRWAQIKIDIESPGGYVQDLAFLVEVDLSTPGDAPEDWRFAGGWFAGNNLKPLASSRCADLPVAKMLFPEWTVNPGTYVEIDLRVAGATDGPPASCAR